MNITLVGAGCGPKTLTAEALDAIAGAELIVGAKRLLESLGGLFPQGCETAAAVASDEIARILSESGCGSACVLLSGDVGFYSGARRLLPLLERENVRVLPGVSSAQLLAARLGRPWQDWLLCSAHGVSFDVRSAVCSGRPVFVLTGGADGPADLCRELTEAGLGECAVTVGESLGDASEQIHTAPAREIAGRRFCALNVVLIDAVPRSQPRVPGLPDDAFLRADGVPMTKQLVRAAALSALGVTSEDVCWDIGAGTGSVSVELALHARGVWAVERDAAALDVAEENRKRFCAWNLRLLAGEAPAALKGLPAPDKVFVGGSGGRLREILQSIHAANPRAAVCVTAITPETLSGAVSEMSLLGWETTVTQLSVTQSRKTGASHLMLAQNPVWLIVGCAE